MKKYLTFLRFYPVWVFLVFLNLIIFESHAQDGSGWTILPVQGQAEVSDMEVISGFPFEQTPIYLSTTTGAIRKSTDGGFTWSTYTTGVSAIQDISFISDNVGWAVSSGKVLKTTNGGVSWTIVDVAPVNLRSVKFYTSLIGWAVGESGYIYKSTNGGVSWTLQVSNTNQTLHKVTTLNSTTAIAVGDRSVIVKTNDGGTTWALKNGGNNGMPKLYDVDLFIDIGYAVGENGTILRTLDDGNVWNAYGSGTTSTLRGVYAMSSGRAFACGDNGKALRKGIGTNSSWESTETGRMGTFYSIQAHYDFNGEEPLEAWVAGSAGTMFTYTGGVGCVAPTISSQPQSVTVCEGQSAVLSATINGTKSSIKWKKNGVFIAGTEGPVLTIPNVTPSSAGNYEVVVTSPCGNVTSSTRTITVSPLTQPSTITGSTTPQTILSNTYSVSPMTGATFNWSAGTGSTITGSGNVVQITWSSTGARTISVTATSACGTSIARTLAVNVTACATPGLPTFSPSPSSIGCTGGFSVFTVSAFAGINYSWTLSGGGTITSSGNTASVNWTSAGSHTVTVTPSNTCGIGTPRSTVVNVAAGAAQPSTITGNTTVCTGVSTPYSVTNVAGVTYTWSTGGGGTVTGSGNAINVTWTSAGAKTLTVTPSTACGNGTPRSLAVTVNAVPSQPSVIAGSTTVATGSSNQFSVTNEAGVTYVWNAGTGGTVTGSGNSVSILWSSAGSKTITLTPSNSCGNGTARTLNVTVNDCAIPIQPSVVTGGVTACTSGSGTYSVTNVGGVTYTWNAGTDGFVSGSGNSVMLSWTSVGVKTITVTPSNACGNGTPRTLAVTVSQLPSQPSAITGNITPCKNASLGYSVTNVAGVTYTWDVVGTGTITGSGNSVNVTWPATGSHTLRVTPSNACGAGVATTLAVTVNDVPLAASQMTGLTDVCSNSSIPYSVGNVAGVTYTWSGGSGSTITGSTNAVSISWSTGGTKTVSVTPSNACGNGTASTKNVEVGTSPAQPSTIVGSTTAVGGITQSYSVTNTPGVTYTWSTSADGVIASTGNTAQVTWSTVGAKTLTVTPSNLCGNGTARTLAVTTTIPCTIPGTPSSMTIGLGGSSNIALNDFRRFVVGASSGATSLNIAVSPSAGTTITPVFGNTWDIVFTIPGTYTVSGFGEISGCGAGAPANITVEVCTGTVAAPTAINGPSVDVCSGTTKRYSVTPVQGIVFDWSLGSISSGTISPLNADRSIVDVTWSSTFGGDNLSVKAKNACNVQSSNFTLTVFSKGKPSYAGFGMFLTGSICAGSGGTLSMNIGLPEPATTYTWQLNGAGTISGDNLSASALADGLSRQIKIYGTNACFQDEFITAIDYGGGSPIPVTPSPVSGPSTIDYNTVGTYSVDAQSAGVNFSWDAGSDATITPGASANIKNIQWSTGGLKTVFVNAVNTCGDGYRSYSVFVNGPCDAPSVPGAISGETTVCAGVEYQYSVPFQNFDTFNWSAGADATITGSGSIRTIKWSTGGPKTISVTATNLCTTSTARTLAVTVNTIPSQPATLTGSASSCNGVTQQISLASPVAGVTYTWEVQGGTFTTSGAQSQIADITWTSLGVNQVKLKPSNSCGNGTPRTLDVTVGTVPDQPSFISGEGEVCSATSKTYSVTNTSGVTYAWNAGSGGTVTGSGNSVSISWSTTGSKTITLTPSNACGNGTARTLTVNVGGVPAQPAAIAGLASPTLGNEEVYAVTSVTGVNYTWSLSDKGTLAESGNNASVFWNTPGTATLTVTPSNTCGNGTARTASITVNKISQTITFTVTSPMLANQTLTLNGEASSGLPVTYISSNTSVAEIFGNELIIKSSGSVDITASQAGDETFATASSIVRTLTINKANQLLTFDALSAATFGEGDSELEGTTDSGLPVGYASSNTDVATVSGNVLTIVGAGTTNITATQGGDAIFNAATPVVRALVVNKADQSISFDPLSAKGINDPPFTLTATASSELAVTYSSSNENVATISGSTVTLVGEGTTTITATQAGNVNYTAATPVEQTLEVNGKEGQTITFGALPAKTFGDADFELSASASSSLAVSYTSSNVNVATVSGTTVTIVGAGSTTLTASQGGNEIFNPATSVQQVLTVNRAAQTITFAALPEQLLSTSSLVLSATSTAGLAISYSSSNTSVATVSGATLTFHNAGTTTITASQSGNDNYNAALAVDQVLTITAKQSQTISFAALFAKIVGDAPFELSASATSNLAVQFVSSNTSVATINGNLVSIVGAGTTTITATQAGNDSFEAATNVSHDFVVAKANQTIAFSLPASVNFTTNALSLEATSSVALPVSFASANTSIATIDGSTLTFIAPGTVEITASQAGNANYNAANNVVASLTIVDDRQTIALSGSLDFGNVLLGETAVKTITIANTGNAVLQISALTLPEGFSSSVGTTTVNANASITAQITFAPTELKEYTGSVVISSTAVSGSNSLALSGTGVTITGFNEPGQVAGDVDVYPNPGNGIFVVKSRMTLNKSIAVMDLSGKSQHRILKSLDEEHHELDLLDLPQGIYYLKIEEKGSVAVKRIVKLN